MKNMRALLATALLAATFLAAPASADPLNVDLGFLDPWAPELNVGEDDHPDASARGVLLGPCGCNCPVAGGGATIAAAGQRVAFLAATALVVCGVMYSFDLETGAPDATGTPSASPRLVFYPGGIQLSGITDSVDITLPPLP